MKKILGLVLYAGMMFGITAGLGMFMLKKTASHGVVHSESEAGSRQTDHSVRSPGPGNAPEYQTVGMYPSDSQGFSPDEHSDHAIQSGTHDERLPVAVRATPMSVEEIVRMGLSLKSRDEVVRKREASLREFESQQKLSLLDIEAAQQDIENLLAQTSDQRAATEELLARVTAQNENLNQERQVIANEREQLKKEREEFEAARKQLETDKIAVSQRENELAKITLDGESLVRDREKWVEEKEAISAEKKQVALDREQLRVERELFEQERRVHASATGASSLDGKSSASVPDEATQLKNMKAVAQQVEAMSPENAAASIRVMAAGNDLDKAVEILMLLEQRKSGAIMDALMDETLATELLLKMSTHNSTSRAGKKP